MIEQNEVKQNLDANTRLVLIRDNFCRSMETVLRPHTHLKSSEASGIYMRELSDAINQRMSTEIPNSDAFIGQLRKIWSLCLQKQKSQFWFSIGDVCKAASTVNSEWVRRFSGEAITLTTVDKITKEEEERNARTPWTLAGAIKQLENTDDLIREGSLARSLGLTLRKIPLREIEKLGGNAEQYRQPPATKVHQKVEPPLPPAPDFELIKSGMTKPDLTDDEPLDTGITVAEALGATEPAGWDAI